jgi:carboxyl-terminal processing protease
MTRAHRLRRLGSGLLAVGVLVFSGCSTLPRTDVPPRSLTAAERTALNLKVHDAVWVLVNEHHFDPTFRGVDWNALRTKHRDAAAAAKDEAELYRVLGQLCRELGESHLVASPPPRAANAHPARRLAVGMGWITLGGRQVVTEVFPGGPAALAGVQPGWVIVACEGRPLTEAPPPSPQPGRPVTYTFLDLKNEERTIPFQPTMLTMPKREASSPLPGGYHYLRFDAFDRDSLFWLNRELKAHRDAPGVVIDLRRNPGGYVFTAGLAIAQFFDHAVATGTFVRRSGRSVEGRGWPFFSAQYPGRVVVLAGGATASAAEIFAHVLQFEKRAVVVGRRTAGAVIISRSYPLPDGGTLQVPVEDYLGRDGQRLEGRGVTPDRAVRAPSFDEIRQGVDVDLEEAVAALGAPGAIAPSGK